MKRNAWNRNIHYHDLVLRAVPPNCRRALDVGCGEGRFASELADCCGEVIAMDADAPTIGRARLTRARPNISYVEGDAMTFALAERSFDFVALIATLHHLPLEPALMRFRALLRPAGVLAVIGLYRSHRLSDLAWAALAVPVSWWWRLTRNYEEVAAPIRDPDETLEEVRATVRRLLPGATFRRELLFRYSLVWTNPVSRPQLEQSHSFR